ncbi:BrnA antitoxin family protein [Glaciimonas sp. PAMC28666]
MFLSTKKSISIRLDADVLAALKASGDGWQTRINDALRALFIGR